MVRLPPVAELRRTVGVVAHVFSTSLSEVWEMELRELDEWAAEAGRLVKQLYGNGKGR